MMSPRGGENNSGGDAFVFGGISRLAHHGVPRTLAGGGPAGFGLDGRVNVTVRASGLR
ncbi:hypothetical protein [Streptomyces sp. NBC_01803]|uniref:hypothetical protein n=1 Tax=Streptomyces sp. NBC_01803 TaxID=2975946 RepID=UPI003FA36943